MITASEKALETCLAAFKAFAERDTTETRRALAEARVRFQQAAEAELAHGLVGRRGQGGSDDRHSFALPARGREAL